MPDSPTSVRIDKWLWAARMFKTRSMATDACTAGHVELNQASAKPSKAVKPGDRIEVLAPGGKRMLEVVALGEKRGPAAEAQALYVDHTPPEERVRKTAWEEAEVRVVRGEGRPEKRDRRNLEKLRGW